MATFDPDQDNLAVALGPVCEQIREGVQRVTGEASVGCAVRTPGDTDLSTRWSLIKGHFSRAIGKVERISQGRAKRGERGLWQGRFWEHLMRDQASFNRHVDYVHWNPVKHGWVRRAWPIGLIPVSMRSGGEDSIRKIGVARTSQVLRQGSNGSDAVLFVHRILRVLPYSYCTQSLCLPSNEANGDSETHDSNWRKSNRSSFVRVKGRSLSSQK